MKVYIVNYRGTVYAVFDSLAKAKHFASVAFGEDSEANILIKDVE